MSVAASIAALLVSGLLVTAMFSAFVVMMLAAWDDRQRAYDGHANQSIGFNRWRWWCRPLHLRIRFLHWLAARCAARGEATWIHLRNELYLERYVLRGGRKQRGDKINVYLHRFHQPDDDRGPHNHPWKWSFSLILAGGYREVRVVTSAVHAELATRTLGAGSINWIGEEDFHRITELLPGRGGEVWTLFVTGPKHGKSWGFLIDWVFQRKRDEGGCNRCAYGSRECETKSNL